jgi:hypothetical protein
MTRRRSRTVSESQVDPDFALGFAGLSAWFHGDDIAFIVCAASNMGLSLA